MGKNIRLGSAKEDDPIYKEGLQSYVPISRPLTSASPKSTDGGGPISQPATDDPMPSSPSEHSKNEESHR